LINCNRESERSSLVFIDLTYIDSLQNQLISQINYKWKIHILNPKEGARGKENNEDKYPSRKFYYLPNIILSKVLRFHAGQRKPRPRGLYGTIPMPSSL
jgi:hypothetical protein